MRDTTMKDLCVLVVGGGSGLGALLVRMAVEAGASKIGIIDINRDAAETALGLLVVLAASALSSLEPGMHMASG